MDHINLFQTNAEFLSAYTNSYVEPWVSYTMETSGLSFNKEQTPPHDYSQDYLTFEIISAGTITWDAKHTGLTKTISYSKDDGETWTSITSAKGSSAPSINVYVGDIVQFKGDNSTYASDSSKYTYFSGTSIFNAYGNIMSLINSTGFTTASTLTDNYTFYSLFKSNKVVVDASNLVLPATTLAQSCYGGMFQSCTSLTSAPALPATTLATECYKGMFAYCTSLTSAPTLPATTLAQSCYGGMFQSCTSLTSAPALPATTLTVNCYSSMFNGCTSLTTAPELPATTLAQGCYSSMFQGCTSLTTAPALSATTLADSCYTNMFFGCTSLNHIECLATDISADYCTNYWVQGVAASGTFVKNANMSSWTTGDSGIPTNWTVEDAS